jgi:hypothetical protein
MSAAMAAGVLVARKRSDKPTPRRSNRITRKRSAKASTKARNAGCSSAISM